MAALLVEARISGVQLLETREDLEGVGDALQVAQSDRDHVEHIAVFGHFRGQRLRRLERRRELAPFQERTYPLDFRVDLRGGLMVAACIALRAGLLGVS